MNRRCDMVQGSRCLRMLRGESGAILIIALLVLLVISLLGIAGLMIGSTEIQIAGNQYRGTQALHTADGGGEMVRMQLGQIGTGAADALMATGLPAVDWTTIPGTNPTMQFRVISVDDSVAPPIIALKNPAVGPDDYEGVRKGSPIETASDVSFVQVKFQVGEIEGNIPSLGVSRRTEMVISFPSTEGY